MLGRCGQGPAEGTSPGWAYNSCVPEPVSASLRSPIVRGGPLMANLSIAVLLAAALITAGCGGTGPSPSPSANPSPTVAPRPSPTPAPTPEPSPATIELIKAVSNGQVLVKGTGHGLQWLDVTLTSKERFPLVVVINQGTLFDAAAERTQSMVVIARRIVDLEAGASVPVQLDVACADMKKDTPDRNDRFSLHQGSVPKELVRLTRLPAFADQPFRLQQFAIWTITDNPARSGYVGLGTAGGSSSGPSLAELKAIAALFRAAQIEPADYRALKGL